MGAVLSLFVPGLGYLYHGRPFAGFAWLCFVAFSYLISIPLMLALFSQSRVGIIGLFFGFAMHVVCILMSSRLDQEKREEMYGRSTRY